MKQTNLRWGISPLQYVSSAIVRHANRMGCAAHAAARINARWYILTEEGQWILYSNIIELQDKG